jgi:hypothetical protein
MTIEESLQPAESYISDSSKKYVGESKINTFRKNATIVGVLYILGTVFGILSVIFTQPVANAQDHFAVVTSNENRVIIGAIFILMMGLVLAMVPVVLFPILKKVDEALALG